MSAYRDIHRAISAHQDETMDGPALRLMKLSEEAGEVVGAYIGYVGANARRGLTHNEVDIAKELADVVITGMVALHDWVDDPERFMEGRLQALLSRIKKEGS